MHLQVELFSVHHFAQRAPDLVVLPHAPAIVRYIFQPALCQGWIEALVFAHLVENRPWLFTLCGLWGYTQILKMDWWPPNDIGKPKGKIEVHFSLQLIDRFPFWYRLMFFFMISAIAWHGLMCFTGLVWSVEVVMLFIYSVLLSLQNSYNGRIVLILDANWSRQHFSCTKRHDVLI